MSEPARTDRVECPPAKDPAVRMFIFAGMLLAFGLWCFYDSFIQGAYPYPEDGNLNEVAKFYFNRVGGIVLPIAGLIPLALALRHLKRKLVATAEGIGYEPGPQLAWGDVTRLDATDLPDKGVLRLEHGAGKPMTLDSWKLQNFKALVALVEQHVPPDTIEPPAAEPGSPAGPSE